MGSTTARDIANEVSEGLTNLEAALIYHFRSNHYPPLPLSLIPVAIQIVKGEVTDEVELPDGITWRGQTSAPVSECIDAWHLEHFIISHEDYEQEE